MSRTPTKRPRHVLKMLALVLALSGCAAQMAYREGNDLVEKDQVEAGLLKFQDAIAREPLNAKYRAAFLQARDRATVRYLDQAERLLADGQREPAQQLYGRVLALDPQNERGRAGMRKIDADVRHAQALAAATELAAKFEYDAARARLNTVLTERPDHPQARAMLRELADKSAPAPAESALSKAYRQPITIEFRDAPLKQIFELIARRSGLNFIFDKDVKADLKASIYLKNSTVESAIYYLLMTNQLEQQVMDANTIMIYPNVAAKQKEYQEMVVKTFYLANADAKQFANTLKTILKTRDVVVDEKLNLVIMRDSPEAVRLAERLVAVQDMAEPEVMLDVEILEIKRSRLLELGVAWPSAVSFSPLKTTGGAAVTLADLNHLNQSTIGISSLDLKLNAKKTDGDSNLLANPRIRVRNKEKAKILIGDKVPVITSTISGGVGTFNTESVSYIDVGLTLNAEPTIYLNNEVAIRVALEVSNIVSTVTSRLGTTAYQIGTRQASTMLQLKDGENQVLAGLINNEDRSTGNKVPLAGDIPILGRLFGSTLDDNQKTEIVLSITPHIVRSVQRPESSMSEFSAGTEGNFRRRPDTAVRLPAQLPSAAGAAGASAAAPAPGRVTQAGTAIAPQLQQGQLLQQRQRDPSTEPAFQLPAPQPAADQGGAQPQAIGQPQTTPLPAPDMAQQQPAPLGVPLSSGQPGPASSVTLPTAPTTPPVPAK